jgi:tetratricopeptide (TPR) repeat protein
MCSTVCDHTGEGATRLEAELGAERVGTSMWGVIYRSLNYAHCYRLIPGDQGVTADRQAQLQQLAARPRQPGLAPVVDARYRSLDERWFVVVSYEVGAERTLVHALASEDPADRVAAIAATLRAMPNWWARVGRGFIPMPSDIVFVEGIPHLLPLPPWGAPAIEALFAERERALYLAPEIVRGDGASVWGNSSDLFSLGVMLLQCFVVLPDCDVDRLLQQIACGVAFLSARCESQLPFWLQKVGAVQRALEAARRLTGPDPRVRSALDPLQLAVQLEACPSAMNPATAVRELREGARSQEAMDLAQAILLDEPSYDLLLLAAEIAWQDLGNPLEGLSLLDKAVVTAPRRTQAYADQFALISDLRLDIIARLAYAIDPSFAERLDNTMEAAFEHLPAKDRDARAGEMARYLIDRKQLVRAAQFIYEKLHEGRTLLWWRFDLMLAYAETFLRLDRLDEAKQQVDQIKSGLRRVRRNRTMSEAEIQKYGAEVTQLELRLHERRVAEGAR